MTAPLLRRPTTSCLALAVSLLLLLHSELLPVTRAALNATVQTCADSSCTQPLPAPLGVAASSVPADAFSSCFPATASLAAQGFSWYAFQCLSAATSNQGLGMWLWPASYAASSVCPAITASTYYSYEFNDQRNSQHTANVCVAGDVIRLINNTHAGGATFIPIYATFLCSPSTTSSAPVGARADRGATLALLAATLSLCALVAF